MHVTCMEHTSHVYSTLQGNVVHTNFCRGTTRVHACKCEVIIERYRNSLSYDSKDENWGFLHFMVNSCSPSNVRLGEGS